MNGQCGYCGRNRRTQLAGLFDGGVMPLCDPCISTLGEFVLVLGDDETVVRWAVQRPVAESAVTER